jgi:hypothetical protein
MYRQNVSKGEAVTYIYLLLKLSAKFYDIICDT